MKFKVHADVADQSKDMPISLLSLAEAKAVFHYDQTCAKAIKLQRTAVMRQVRTATLDHPDLLFTHCSKVITGTGNRTRLALPFGKSIDFTQIITDILKEHYGRRVLAVVYHIWIGDDAMTASFAPIDDLYRNKVRQCFIDSFIHQL